VLIQQVLKHGFNNKKEVKKRKGVNIKIEQNLETPKPNGKSNGHLLITEKSRPVKAGSLANVNHSTFDPN